MERIKQISESRLQRVPLTFFRFLINEINWDDRLIGISGARGTGKTTLLLQFMKNKLPANTEALYVSLDDIYFAQTPLVYFAEEFYKKAYHAANPFDIYDDFRDEACKLLSKYGIKVKYHHHEVGERGQQEIETYFSDLLATADNIITAKYILFNFARQKDLFITFMPKPMYQQAGNGMHLHLYLTKKGKNAFYKKGEYGNMNQLGRYFIGGMLKHAPALSAFTNPSTNSYKRLVPGFEAPVALTYGMGNRASAIRIPKYVNNEDETRFEYRPPDATANPYLCLTAMLLAGIDGVVNKIDPVAEGFGPIDKNFFEEDDLRNKIKMLPRNLEEAIDALNADNEFLKRGNIFTDELLDQWIKIKNEEIHSIGTMPHPFEFKMYFTL